MGITEKILCFFGYVKIPEQAIRINAIKHGTTALDNFLREGARAGAPNRKAGE